MLLITLIIVLGFILIVAAYMRLPKFGKLPAGERLAKIKKQKNYVDDGFQNISYTPQLTDGATFFSVLKKFMFNNSKRLRPATPLPSQKTNLFTLNPTEDVLVWFGHSSYFLQVDGNKILVDPVFSGSASPLSFTTKSFPGADIYTVDDMPPIDYLIITHDHYDHLDYETMIKLRPKVGKVITSLGVGEHLEFWGFDKDSITELGWNEGVFPDTDFSVNTTPARHFSGRTFKRNQSLWQSFVLSTPTLKLFLGGDSGYDVHFEEIGLLYGPFDLVILECGQYDKAWKYIHMLPDETVQAAKDLRAKVLLPVHWGKFKLANHDWDTPINEVTKIASRENIPIITPMIGQKVNLNAPGALSRWWEGL